jgi:hypothetical protein
MSRAVSRLLACGVVCGVTVTCSSGARVSVINNSGQRLSNTVVTFTGGHASFGELQPNETRTLPIHSSGESHATISFSDTSGNVHKKEIDIYLESGHRGLLQIMVDPNLEVTYQNSLSP